MSRIKILELELQRQILMDDQIDTHLGVARVTFPVIIDIDGKVGHTQTPLRVVKVQRGCTGQMLATQDIGPEQTQIVVLGLLENVVLFLWGQNRVVRIGHGKYLHLPIRTPVLNR
ncbi:MAG: hypothetical protein ACFFFG_01520 [Candidatus Thorarchaeota archaeon]